MPDKLTHHKAPNLAKSNATLLTAMARTIGSAIGAATHKAEELGSKAKEMVDQLPRGRRKTATASARSARKKLVAAARAKRRGRAAATPAAAKQKRGRNKK